MNSTSGSSSRSDITIGQAALISGFGLLIMVLTAPVAEMYIIPKLVDYSNASVTFQNIAEQKQLLIIAIFLYLITFIADVVVAWALYIYFKPVYRSLSLLTAWFRIIYTAMALFGLFNLIKVLELVHPRKYLSKMDQGTLDTEVMFHIQSFQQEWGIAFVFFGITLGLLGYLAYKSSYVPKIIGVLLLLAGLGYFLSSLQPYFYPSIDTSFLMITFFGELIFMVWLLFKGWRVDRA